MSKTAYEIRLDLLNLATSILTQQVESINSFKHLKASSGGRVKEIEAMPTTEQVVKEAEKLKAFIDDKRRD